MARTIATIKEAIRVQKNTYDSISSILFKEEGGSAVGVLNNMADTIAININILEQLLDTYVTELEGIAATAVPGTATWLQQKVMEFQYDADIPQVIQLIDLIPTYPVVDEELQIITRAAVTETGNGRVTVRVAKSDPPEALTTDELTALEDYLEIIGPAGPQITALSLAADRIEVTAEVFYNGQYSTSIQADVELAINNYLGSLEFDGIVYVSKIQDAIQAVAGVKDVVIGTIKARKESTAYSGATTVTRLWNTVAGYIIEEDTASHTFADTITYTAE
jgi:hypothetical protein